jgi:hypothetical protein
MSKRVKNRKGCRGPSKYNKQYIREQKARRFNKETKGEF